jgi:hypothetical protein
MLTYVNFIMIACQFEMNRLSHILEMILGNTRCLTKLMLMKFQCLVSMPSKTFGTQPITRASSASHTRGRPTALIRRKFGYASRGTTLA